MSQELSDRIATLERKFSRWRLVVGLMIVGLFISALYFWIGQNSPWLTPNLTVGTIHVARSIVISDDESDALSVLNSHGHMFTADGDIAHRRVDIGLGKGGMGELSFRDTEGESRLSLGTDRDGNMAVITFATESGDVDMVLGKSVKGRGLFIVDKDGPRLVLSATNDKSMLALRAGKGRGMTTVHASDESAGTSSQVGSMRVVQLAATEDQSTLALRRDSKTKIIRP